MVSGTRDNPSPEVTFLLLKVALNFNFLKKRKSKMADPRWRIQDGGSKMADNHFKF